VHFSGRRLPRPYDALEVVVRDVEPRAPGAVSEQALASNVLWRIDEDGDGRMTGWLGKVADRLTLTAPKVACAVNHASASLQVYADEVVGLVIDLLPVGPAQLLIVDVQSEQSKLRVIYVNLFVPKACGDGESERGLPSERDAATKYELRHIPGHPIVHYARVCVGA
jgi:hypothetical protein